MDRRAWQRESTKSKEEPNVTVSKEDAKQERSGTQSGEGQKDTEKIEKGPLEVPQ